MKTIRAFLLVGLAFLTQAAVRAADQPDNENGAVQIYTDYGFSAGYPANQALVSVGSETVVSPKKTVLNAPSFGVGVTAWKWLVPFVDVTAYDTGTATAGIGPLTTKVTDKNTVTTTLGMRFVRGKSNARAYAELGGGWVYQDAQVDFSLGNSITSQTVKTSGGEVMYGTGVQYFISRRLGFDMGIDGFHATEAFYDGGHNFVRARIGFFFQTKSTAK